MKMKPKEYKKVSNKEKSVIKFSYDYEKAKTGMIEKEIQELEKMYPLDYLTALNTETKEQLIGLCLNRNLFDEETDWETEIDNKGDEEQEEEELEEEIEREKEDN